MKRPRQTWPLHSPNITAAPGLCVTLLLVLFSGFCSARVLHQDTTNETDSASGGFLANELPLEIVVTTPSQLADNATQSLGVRNQQALTVVYSRSVIALGQDFGTTSLPDDKVPFTLEPEVPGRFRWVATYIARWDPDGSWPLDSEIKFTFNPKLTTHDGISMDSSSGSGRSVILTTPSLSMSIRTVKSEKASNLTDGGWDARTGLNSDILPEVPPDGVIELNFNTKVSLTALEKSLQVLNDTSNEPAEGLAVSVEPCKPRVIATPKPCLRCAEPAESSKSEEESNCAAVSIDGQLQMGTRYALSLPEGTKYSERDGTLKSEKKVTFGGLRKFVIPFLEFREEIDISTNFLRMWLPHGLQKTNESDIQILKQAFTLTAKEDGSEVEFELELEEKDNLRILTSLIPERAYTLTVNGSSDILDGFGLPLEASSGDLFTRAIDDGMEVFRPDRSYGIFEAGEDWGRKIVAAFRGNPRSTCPGLQDNTVNIYPLLSTRSIRMVSRYLNNNNIRETLSESLGKPAGQLQAANELGEAELVEFDIGGLINPTGLVAGEFCSRFGRNTIELLLMNESDMHALILGTRNNQAIVWVTSMKTGRPIEGATVTLFRIRRGRTRSLGSEKTDAQGQAFFDGLSGVDFAQVVFRKKVVFVRSIDSGFDNANDNDATLVLDRALVKPGDTLHVKGYTKGAAPINGEVRISPAFDPESRVAPRFPVELDERFGTFELEIPVPENATNRNYGVSYRAGRDTSASRSFTVGDPRPPTVGLTVEAPFWAKPDSKIPVNVTTESFIGAAVGDAEVSLKWSVSGGLFNSVTFEGEAELVTDAFGQASTEIDLGALDKEVTSDRSLRIDVSWVGPTRELLEESTNVLLRNADFDVSIDQTVFTDFPGQEFGAKVGLTNLMGTPLDNVTLVLNLKNITVLKSDNDDGLPTSSSLPVDAPILESCEVQSNSVEYDCRFSIPDLGFFALEACAGSGADQLCDLSMLGKTAEEWRAGLLTNHLPVGLVALTKGPHKVGDEVKFGLENPYQNTQALLMWGSRIGVDHMTIPLNDNSFSEFSVTVGENCKAGCDLTVGVMIPRQTDGIALNSAGVPASKLFDLAAPHAVELSYTIDVEVDVPLDVEVSFPDATEDGGQDFVIAPGQSTPIQINITDSNVDEAEVTVIAVDKAFLELVDNALTDLTKELDLSTFFDIGLSTSTEDLITPGAIDALVQDFGRKKDIDPWFSPAYQLDDLFGSPVDVTDKAYVDSRSRYITVDGNDYSLDPDAYYSFDIVFSEGSSSVEGFGLASAAVSAPLSSGQRSFARASALSSSSALEPPPPPPSSTSVRVLEDFVTTALFETVVAKDGIVTVNFTAPDNLGTFNIRAYVATETEQFGSVEKELIVRRAISLTPSAPRFVRVGDEFEAGAVVTVSGANPSQANVSVVIDLMGEESLEIVEDSSRTVNIGEDGTAEVRFRFKAKQIGDASFKISADVSPSSSDALIINFPVEGLQEGVTVASSFAIDGNSSSQWQEGLQLPEAVPGSGAVTIQAGVGRLPAVLSMAGQLYESNPEHKCPINSGFALALVTIPFVTETYKVLDLDPASLDQNSLQVIDGITSNFTASLESLQEMTRGDIGLDYFLSCKKNPRTFPDQPSLSLNARAVFLLKLLEQDLNTLQREVVLNGVPPLMILIEEWTQALENALLRSARLSRDNDRAIFIGSVALARAALGGDWVPPSDVSQEIMEDLSMERLSAEFDSMDIEDQALYIVARQLMDGGENHPDIQRAITAWTSNFRVTGRTTYIARAEGSSTPASNVANSLALGVMVRAEVDNPLLDKLANYIGSPPVSQYGFRVFSDYDKAIAMISLRDYDVDRGSDQPDLQLQVRSGNVTLMDVEFVGNANLVASSSTPWEELASPPETLEFRANGTGEVTLAAALTFVPARLLPFPTYRGIFVQRSIYIADSDDSNQMSLKTIPVTSVVEISIQFTTPDRLGPTTVRVLMPAGLEPVDPNIAGSRDFCPVPFASLFRGNSFGRRRPFFFFNCPDQETEPSVVTFRYNSVNSGTQTVSFRAVAATAGKFALPPVKAFVNEQPEVMGLSPAGELEICSGADCVAEVDEPLKIPKNCPKDCSDNGACDLDSGTCLCLDGFTGVDCGELVVV